MNDYPSNSFKSRENNKEAVEKRKVEKVVKGTVKTKKKSGIKKFSDVFISEDVSNVKSFVLMDVLVPAAKKAISDVVTNGIDMILYGGTGKRNSNSRFDKPSYTNYSRKYDDPRDNLRARSRYDHDDIVLESRGEAEEVLRQMDDLIDTYGSVSVADLYDLVGKSSEYTDNKYGWTNIRNAEPIRVSDGYLLKLPKVIPITQ